MPVAPARSHPRVGGHRRLVIPPELEGEDAARSVRRRWLAIAARSPEPYFAQWAERLLAKLD